MPFTHLHLHTQYSLLDGAILIPELVAHLKSTGMEACAITDHGWMAGIIDFYKVCKKESIKPLIGVEAYITNDADNLPNEVKSRDNMHMILIAKDNEGLRLLINLVSNAALHNFYYKPRIFKQHLSQLSGHVVATSACLGGVIASQLSFAEDEHYGKAILCTDTNEKVQTDLEFYLTTFGEDFFLELQVWADPTNYQQTYNQYLLGLAKEKGVPLVLTSDCHYLKKEDDKLHQLLMAMQLKMTVEEYLEHPEMTYGADMFVADPEEMKARALSLNCLEAYKNTQLITSKCNVDIELGKYQVPVFKVEVANDYAEFLTWKTRRDLPSNNNSI